MASMLAKYIPGGIWTPLAGIVWLRRAGGVSDTSFVISSILLEAGLSAVAGILVFTAGLAAVDGRSAARPALRLCGSDGDPAPPARLHGARAGDLPPLRRARAAAASVPDPPRAARLLRVHLARRRDGALPPAALAGCGPGVETIPYLGGTAAVGAIVAVLTVFAPSAPRRARGLDVRLLVVVVPASARSVLNRLAITLVEAALLGGGVLVPACAVTSRGGR